MNTNNFHSKKNHYARGGKKDKRKVRIISKINLPHEFRGQMWEPWTKSHELLDRGA